VKAVLEAHPAVQEAAVVGIDGARLGQLPVAALTLRAGVPAPSEADLREGAKRHLANYQVPARILLVEQLPLTPSLKVSQPGVVALLDGSPG
jgi:acyl-CoA synthetase (AMP-forming)/AMP-acid ligase II